MAETVNMPLPAGKLTGAIPALLAACLALAILASFGVGAYPVPFVRVLGILIHSLCPWLDHPAWDAKDLAVIAVIRPPRILVATFAGIGLGLTGACLQGMMRNPLVGPDLVGVNSGAAFGGAIAVLLMLPPSGALALAFAGGLFAMLCTFSLAKLAGAGEGLPLLLAGFFVGAFFMGGVGLAQYMARYDYMPLIVYWLLGSFRGADPDKLWMIAVPTIIGGSVLMGLRWRINLLSLGDLDAASLGINVTVLRWAIIGVVSLMVAAQVSVSGIIGWVGLVVPHCARMLVGPDHRRLLPASAMLGGMFTLGVDDLTRSIVSAEIPAGLLTAFIGTPIICFLFWKTQTKGWSDE
jgi:iron complex transport system permease protein